MQQQLKDEAAAWFEKKIGGKKLMWATFSEVISGMSNEKLARLFMSIQENSSSVAGKSVFPKDETGWMRWLQKKFDKNEWEEIMERKPDEVQK